MKGWELFKGKAKCLDVICTLRLNPFFSDAEFHNTGIRSKETTFETLSRRAEELQAKADQLDFDPAVLAHKSQFSDLGRFLITKARKDIGAFKTPHSSRRGAHRTLHARWIAKDTPGRYSLLQSGLGEQSDARREDETA
jgi:hypothetical protein